MDNNFGVLNLDLWANIIQYLHDPRDIISLYNSNRCLFGYIIPLLVKKIYIDPSDTTYLPEWVLSRLPNLQSVRCDIRVENMLELETMIVNYPNITELTIRVSSKIGRSMFNLIAYLMCDNHLSERSYRLEKYNTENKNIEDIWIGNGKLSHGYADGYKSILILYRRYLKSLLSDAFYFNDAEYNDIVASMPHLTYLSYIDCGFHPCTSFQLQLMLISNDNLESLSFVPCDYIYEIDNTARFNHIDTFVVNLYNNDTIYDKIKTLSIPLSVNDISKLNNIFPNLTSVGLRYIQNITELGKYDINFDLDIIYNKYREITIFVYVVFDSVNIRQIINRDNKVKYDIYDKICTNLSLKYPRSNIINMNHDLPSLVLARDNWLFDNNY